MFSSNTALAPKQYIGAHIACDVFFSVLAGTAIHNYRLSGGRYAFGENVVLLKRIHKKNNMPLVLTILKMMVGIEVKLSYFGPIKIQT